MNQQGQQQKSNQQTSQNQSGKGSQQSLQNDHGPISQQKGAQDAELSGSRENRDSSNSKNMNARDVKGPGQVRSQNAGADSDFDVELGRSGSQEFSDSELSESGGRPQTGQNQASSRSSTQSRH